jgi:hypothetical protein
VKFVQLNRYFRLSGQIQVDCDSITSFSQGEKKFKQSKTGQDTFVYKMDDDCFGHLVMTCFETAEPRRLKNYQLVGKIPCPPPQHKKTFLLVNPLLGTNQPFQPFSFQASEEAWKPFPTYQAYMNNRLKLDTSFSFFAYQLSPKNICF